MKEMDLEQDEVLQLVHASRAGDKAAFERLVLVHQRQAVGLALGILGNRDDAAEVVQEAFIKAHLSLGRLSQPERFRSWLLKIVANEAVSRRRAARRRKIITRLFVAARVQRRSSEPYEKEDADELQKAVERAMEQLTDGEARAIALFGLDGLPQSRSRSDHGLLGRGGALARAPGQKEIACAAEGASRMSANDRDIDSLLRRNTERQLEGFDWDRQRQTVMQRLAATRIQKPRLVVAIGVATGVAAILTLAVGYVCLSLLKSTDRNATAPTEAAAFRESVGDDSLLASTDPTMILLTGPHAITGSERPDVDATLLVGSIAG